MSNYDLMFNTNNLKPNGGSLAGTNYFEKQIKEGLPFFNENKLQSTLRNNYFNNSDSNYDLRARNNITSAEKIDRSEIEAKKILEREMNPYLSYMKNELKLIVEQFAKDINEKNVLINEISSLKNEIEILKRTNDNLGNEINAKYLKNNENFNLHERKISNIELDLNKFNQIFSIESKQNSQIPTIIVDISHINDKINILEKNNENIFSELGKIVENSTSMKFNEFSTDIKNLKEENSNLKEKIEELNIIIKGLQSDNEKKNEENMNQINNNEDTIKLIKQLKIDLKNKENIIENIENENDNIKNKISEHDKNIDELFNNINTEHTSFITIANNMKNCNKKMDYLEKKINDTVYKKDYIDNRLEFINEQIKSQNDLIEKKSGSLSDILSEKNNILFLELNKQIENSKKSFENYYDTVDVSITSLNNQVNEITSIIKTHPMFNMSSNEIINMNFKSEQNKFNEAIKGNILEIFSKILKLEENSKFINLNKENLIKLNNNFSSVYGLIKQLKEFKITTEENLNNLNNFKSDIENKFNDNLKDNEDIEKINKNIEELNNKISCLEGQLSINAGIQSQGGNVDLGLLNEIKNDIKKLEKDIDTINNEKIPELLKIIDMKIQNQKTIQVPVIKNDNINSNNINNNMDNNFNNNINNNFNNNMNYTMKIAKKEIFEDKGDFEDGGGLFNFSRRRGGRNQTNKKETNAKEITNKMNEINNEFNDNRDNNNNYGNNDNYNNFGNNDNYNNYGNNDNFNNYGNNNNYGYNDNFNNYGNNDNFNNYENNYDVNNYNENNNDNNNNYNDDYNNNNYNQRPSNQLNENYDNGYEDNSKSYRNSNNISRTSNLVNDILSGKINSNKNEEKNNNINDNDNANMSNWD